MDPAKFSHGPENKVSIADSLDRSEFRLGISSTNPERNDANTNVRKKGFLDLRLPGPGEEITEPRHVGMRGSRSGLTFGQTSGIEAVLREPMKNGTSLYTWELLVIPEGEKTAFSRRGDSGSCVFDLEGRVVRVLVGSSGEDPDEGTTAWRGGLPMIWKAKNPVDVSFVSPIRWVLDDIQGFTGFRPRLS
ncbi:hypothetical protein E8E14_002951 [Neopestalotiopsis sp. 37M]|nr:hypothetical protein E8E14_002951 [Neopestalotiopsis sp. 37M]